MFFSIFLFFVGFYILLKGANILVDGAASLASRFAIPRFVTGLVIVGIGTSIPEFAIMFVSNLTGEGALGLGTIIGSNTFNILFIVGVTALFFPLRMAPAWVDRDFLWNIWAVLITLSFAIPIGDGIISRPEGLIMLLLFFFWIYVVIKKTNHQDPGAEKSLRVLAFPLAFGLIVAGLLGVVLGGKWVVDGAVIIAQGFGLSEALIGLTIISIGTSLPELVVTFVAAFRGQPGIAFGNIIGSNIFDFLMILGFAAVVNPIPVSSQFFFDALVTLLASALLFGFMFIGEFYILKRWQGLFLIFLYIVYVVYLMGRG